MVDPSDAAPSVDPVAAALPASLQHATSEIPIERRSWEHTIAPHYIGLFLWIAFFDSLGARAVPMAGIVWPFLGVAIAAILCYQLLYYVPAVWGCRTGRPLTVLATSTFGVKGSFWLTGVVFGLAQLVWLAVATYYAVELTFDGLVAVHLLDPRYLKPVSLGPVTMKSPLFLITTLTWSYAAAAVGAYLVRVIAALMKVFPIFPASMLAMAMIFSLKGLKSFVPTGVDPETGLAPDHPGITAMIMVIQLVFGFFATAGVASADWGAVSREKRDVTRGGWVGVAFASWIIATLAFLTVAGVLGLNPPIAVRGRGAALPALTFHAAASQYGGRFAAAILLLFGLASLAPTCYAAFTFSHRFAAAWPRVSRLTWTMVGTSAAWPLIATGFAARLDVIFHTMGAVFAPMVGALAADYTRARGEWPGPRRGVSQAGVVAWAFGLTVGLIPIVAQAWRIPYGSNFQPAAVFAFLTSFLVYRALAALGLEPPAIVSDSDASARGLPETAEKRDHPA